MMEKTLKKLSWYVFIMLIMVVVISIEILYTNNKNDKQQEQLISGMPNIAVDLIGTKTGTSTEGVGFRITSAGGQSASTTYPYFVGADVDTVVFTNKIKKASSSANLQFTFLGSNDVGCNTASTTTGLLNPILTTDINWFDIGDHLKGKVHSTSLAVGTSSIPWDTSSGINKGRSIILTDLAYRCVALEVSGSSTVLHTQIATKSYK